MTLSRSFDITGIATTVQFGKNGGNISYDAQTQCFNILQKDSSLYSGLSVQKLNVITGDINLITGSININGATIQWQQPNVIRFNGSAAVMIPYGNNSARPAIGLLGMIRVNTESNVRIEYFDGSQWIQIADGAYYTAGTGLTLTNNTFNFNVGPGLGLFGSGNQSVGIKTQSNTAIQINNNQELTLKLDSQSGLIQSSDGLKIGTSSVTNDMLLGGIANSKLSNSNFTLTNGQTTETINLGDSVGVYGTGPISTSLNAKILSISVSQATTSSIGVASFTSNNFNVNNGEVSVVRIDGGTF